MTVFVVVGMINALNMSDGVDGLAGGQALVSILLFACFALYVTAVHTVLDAEPRYSIPYRPEEVLLFITALAWFAKALSGRLRKKAMAPATH